MRLRERERKGWGEVLAYKVPFAKDYLACLLGQVASMVIMQFRIDVSAAINCNDNLWPAKQFKFSFWSNILPSHQTSFHYLSFSRTATSRLHLHVMRGILLLLLSFRC